MSEDAFQCFETRVQRLRRELATAERGELLAKLYAIKTCGEPVDAATACYYFGA